MHSFSVDCFTDHVGINGDVLVLEPVPGSYFLFSQLIKNST